VFRGILIKTQSFIVKWFYVCVYEEWACEYEVCEGVGKKGRTLTKRVLSLFESH